MYVGSFVIYMLVMLVAMNFARKAEMFISQRTKYLGLSFLVVFLFCAFRFYVGNDYANYVEIFYFIQDEYNPRKTEPAFYLLSLPFFKVKGGYLYVFAICSFISTWFIYKAIIRQNCVYYGVFAFFTLELLIFNNNGIRQGVAMSICIFAVEYARKKEYIKYILLVALAFTFHYTACIMLIFLFLTRINIKAKYYYIALIVGVVLYITGTLTPFIIKAIGLTPFYGEHYLLMHANQFEIIKTSSGLGLLFKILVIIYGILKLDTVKDNYYVHIFIIGSLLRICFTGFMLPERIAMYLAFFNVIGFAQVLKFNTKDIRNKIITSIIVLYYALQSMFALESHGAIPYRTFFFENVDKIHYEYKDE